MQGFIILNPCTLIYRAGSPLIDTCGRNKIDVFVVRASLPSLILKLFRDLP